jgi:hypothetical protein
MKAENVRNSWRRTALDFLTARSKCIQCPCSKRRGIGNTGDIGGRGSGSDSDSGHENELAMKNDVTVVKKSIS